MKTKMAVVGTLARFVKWFLEIPLMWSSWLTFLSANRLKTKPGVEFIEGKGEQ